MGIPVQALTALAGKGAVPKPKVPLVRVGTQFFREVEVGKGDTKQVVLVPVDVEFNLDPLELLKALGVAAAGTLALGAAALGSWLIWDGLAVGGFQVWNGLKTVPYWKDQTANAARCGELRTLIRQRRAIMKTPGCDEECKAQMEKEIVIFEAEKAEIGCRF